MAEYIFSRTEMKYLITPEQYSALLADTERYLMRDSYFRYTICNVYFDTDSFMLIGRSLEKPVYKEKLRLRSYGVPADGDTVFLEIKKKYQGIVYKRRISLSAKEAEALTQSKCLPPTDRPSNRAELENFLGKYDPVPKVYIAYDREAYRAAQEDGSALRITFDRNIRYRTDRLALTAGDDGMPLLADGCAIMKIKAGLAMPLWLTASLARNRIYPCSFSKYGRVYQKEFIHMGEKKSV